jgi:hypothetical protein
MLCPLLLALGVPTASAQEVAADQPAPVASTEQDVPTGRKFDLEVGFRGRMMSIPGSVMDIWYENERADFWALPGERRPRIQGYAVGLEFLVKGDTANSIFYVEYLKSTMSDGYWDDVDADDNPLNGEYLDPSDNLGMVTLGANYAYDAPILSSARTGGKFGWSLLIGGGLGIGILTGSIDRWTVDDEGRPAYLRYQSGEEPDDQAGFPPPVLPMVDINAGMRFTFGDRVSVRVEGGLHTMIYYGTSVGLIF